MKGLDKFQAHFANAQEQYGLIGGAAAHLVLTGAGFDPRATKDLDVVLCIEAINAGFYELLWKFIEAGGYSARERSSGEREFYRFHTPGTVGYPKMLEIFSRKPEGVTLPQGAVLTPVPDADDILSLSAIILDDNYYALLQAQNRIVDGVRVLDEKALIPFKARAHIDLKARYEAGDGKIKPDDIAKHRSDVFRLAQLLPADAVIELADAVSEDLARFLDLAAAAADLNTFGVEKDVAIARLRTAYNTR
jgi:hypothetical protein